MDLDFKSIKALSSPTRLEILNHVLDEEATTTGLSKSLDKSKSTVSNHLKVLTESGLLEKDEVEGRRRVVYRPTEKAQAIIEGRERKVKFSVISTALTSVTGIALLGRSLSSLIDLEDQQAEQGIMLQEATEATRTVADASQLSGVDIAVAVVGFGLVTTAALMAIYAYALRKLM